MTRGEHTMSDYVVIRIPRKLVSAGALLLTVLCVAVPLQVRGDAGRAKPLMSQSLPDIPGKELTAVMVSYEPGGKSAPHHHAGDVFAFVVSGSIRSENSVTGPARVYQAGEAFFEPAGSKHLVSENASSSEPAKLLAVFVADAHAQLSTAEK
jgi:quercetin dioxygenase-like cupin family protein